MLISRHRARGRMRGSSSDWPESGVPSWDSPVVLSLCDPTIDRLEHRVTAENRVEMTAPPTSAGRQVALAAKRAIDLTGSLAALVVLGPFLVAVALAIYVVDGRPILFVQDRAGLHGRPFRIVKFRTMRVGADAERAKLRDRNEIVGGASFKLTNDPRVTRLGRTLRGMSIDELPQLVNVLKGQMSLVGPRPHPFDDVAGYADWHFRRFAMKPGITGPWQISARRDTDFDRWVRLDLDYIEHWSPLLDIRIMVSTIPALLRSEGR